MTCSLYGLYMQEIRPLTLKEIITTTHICRETASQLELRNSQSLVCPVLHVKVIWPVLAETWGMETVSASQSHREGMKPSVHQRQDQEESEMSFTGTIPLTHGVLHLCM